MIPDRLPPLQKWLTFDAALYDLEIASGSGNCAVVTRLLEGVVTLSKNVTLGSF